MFRKRRTKYFIVNTKVEIEFFIIIIMALIPIALLYFHLNSRDEIINDFFYEVKASDTAPYTPNQKNGGMIKWHIRSIRRAFSTQTEMALGI